MANRGIVLILAVVATFLISVSVYISETSWNKTFIYGLGSEAKEQEARSFQEFTKNVKEALKETIGELKGSIKGKVEDDKEEGNEKKQIDFHQEFEEIKRLLDEIRENQRRPQEEEGKKKEVQLPTESQQPLGEPQLPEPAKKVVDKATGAFIRPTGWSREKVLDELLEDRHELPLDVRKKIAQDFCVKLNLTRNEGICSDYHYNSKDPLSVQLHQELVSIQYPDNCRDSVSWWHRFSDNTFGLGARIYHFSRNSMAAFTEQTMLIELPENGLPCSPERPLQCWFQPQTDCYEVKSFESHGIIQDRPPNLNTDIAFTFKDRWNLFVPERYSSLGMKYKHFRMTLMRYTFRPADRMKSALENAKKELNWPINEPVITMHIRHGDKANNGLELALIGLVMPEEEYRYLHKKNNLGTIGFSEYMNMANKVRVITGAKTIYMETDDPNIWNFIRNYSEWRFLRWQPVEWNLDTTFTAMSLLGEGDYWIGTFTSSFGRWGYDTGVLFGKLKAGISLDIDWMTI